MDSWHTTRQSEGCHHTASLAERAAGYSLGPLGYRQPRREPDSSVCKARYKDLK